MIPRGTIVAALLVVELAICGEAVVAITSGQPRPSSQGQISARAMSGDRLVEGGPHQVFHAGTHPALTVDIGYADLTIIASTVSEIDVSVSPSTAYGFFQETAPITARADGATIRVARTRESSMSIGDDRMVTVLVPPGTAVTVINAGDIKASGLRGKASFHGDGQGHITLEDYAGPDLVASSNGRVSLVGVGADHLEVTSKDGRVEGTALRVRNGIVESSERVNLGFATGADTLVTAQTDSGKVHLEGFPATAAVANAGKNSEDDDDDGASQTVRVGAGNGRLDVHSSDGNITLTLEGN